MTVLHSKAIFNIQNTMLKANCVVTSASTTSCQRRAKKYKTNQTNNIVLQYSHTFNATLIVEIALFDSLNSEVFVNLLL